MRLFSEEVTPTFTSSNLNILTVKDFNEVFFDVYELEINGKKYVTEKVSEYKGSPVVSVNIVHNNKEYSTKCVLQRGKFSLLVNEQTLKYEGESSIIDDDILIESTKEDEVEEIIFEKHESILEDIQKAKQSARDYLQKLKEQHEAQLIESQEKKAKEIKKELKAIRQDLVEEFIQIASNTQQEISESNDALKKGITSKVNILTKALEGHVNNKTESLQSLLEKKFNDLVLDITNGVISKKLEDGQKFVEENIKRVLQAVDDKLTTIDQVSINLNDSIQKSSNKALSRIGNVKTKLEESITNSVTVLQHDIDKASIRIREYYDNEITKLNETVSLLGDETKKECIKLVSESRDSLLKTINEIKVEVPNIVIEKKDGTNQEIDLKKVKAELEKSITTRFSTELMSLKKMIEMMSGGGSVAQQFANGGVMNGNLTIVGAISASQYLGLSAGGSGGVSGDYLPLSGGTITGNLTVNGTLSAGSTSGSANNIVGNTNITGTGSNQLFVDYQNRITLNGGDGVTLKADSGYVTISGANGVNIDAGGTGLDVDGNLNLDGRFTALSGANVTGNVTINGNISANNITSNNYFLSGSSGKLTTSTNVRGWKFPQIGSQSLSAAASPRDIYFTPDGMVAYVLSNTNRRVYSFNLSQAWDITTTSVIPSLTSVQVDLNPEGFSFSPDGIYMFVIAQSNRIVSRYTMPLSAAWDISQATLDNTILLNSVLGVPTTLTFKPDGTKMYVFGETNDVLYEYNLSTPWTVSTALSSRFISFPTGTTGIILNSDGTRLLSINSTTDFISEYTLPIPWSLSGAYFDANMYQTTRQTAPLDESSPTGLYYNDTVNKCFFIGTALTRAIEVTVVPQPAIIGTRPLILSNPTDVNDKVNINSLRITDTTATTNTATGALIVNGGIGCAGVVYSDTVFGVNNVQVGSGTFLGINGRSRIYSPADNILRLTNNSANNFDRLQFGDITSSFPAIKRNGSGLDIVLADDTGFTDLRVRSLSASTVTSTNYSFSAYPTMNIYANSNSVFIQSGSGLTRLIGGSIRLGNSNFLGFTGNVTGGQASNVTINRISENVLGIGAGEGPTNLTNGSLALSSLSARNITLSGGDIEVTNFTNGVILKSPNGTRFRITVGDDGALTTTTVV